MRLTNAFFMVLLATNNVEISLFQYFSYNTDGLFRTLHGFFKTAKEDVDRLFTVVPPHMRSDILHLPGYPGSVSRREESPAAAINGRFQSRVTNVFDNFWIYFLKGHYGVECWPQVEIKERK